MIHGTCETSAGSDEQTSSVLSSFEALQVGKVYTGLKLRLDTYSYEDAATSQTILTGQRGCFRNDSDGDWTFYPCGGAPRRMNQHHNASQPGQSNRVSTLYLWCAGRWIGAAELDTRMYERCLHLTGC